MSTPTDPNPFVKPLAEIEAHVSDAEARGEQLPPQAYALLAKLRELVAALRDLDGVLAEPPADSAGTPTPPGDDPHRAS